MNYSDVQIDLYMLLTTLLLLYWKYYTLATKRTDKIFEEKADFSPNTNIVHNVAEERKCYKNSCECNIYT